MSESLVSEMARAINSLFAALDAEAAAKTDRQKAKAGKAVIAARQDAKYLVDIHGLAGDSPAKKVVPLTVSEWEKAFISLHGKDAKLQYVSGHCEVITEGSEKPKLYDSLVDALIPDNKLPPQAYAALASLKLQAAAATAMLMGTEEEKADAKYWLYVAQQGMSANEWWTNAIFKSLMGSKEGGIDAADNDWLEREFLPWIYDPQYN
jgi:hypothetical protein